MGLQYCPLGCLPFLIIIIRTLCCTAQSQIKSNNTFQNIFAQYFISFFFVLLMLKHYLRVRQIVHFPSNKKKRIHKNASLFVWLYIENRIVHIFSLLVWGFLYISIFYVYTIIIYCADYPLIYMYRNATQKKVSRIKKRREIIG